MSLEHTSASIDNERESETDKLAFHNACSFGHLNVVQLFLRKEFDMYISDDAGTTGFHFACCGGNLNVVQFLVQQGFDMNVHDNYGSTGFYLACFNGKLKVVQFLLQQGFENINKLGFGDKTGLEMLIAQQWNCSDDELFMPCILLLIESGAKLNKHYVFEELISAIQNRIIEITFIRQTIFEKWTGRIAQAIADFTTNKSLQNLTQVLDQKISN